MVGPGGGGGGGPKSSSESLLGVSGVVGVPGRSGRGAGGAAGPITRRGLVGWARGEELRCRLGGSLMVLGASSERLRLAR